MCTLAQFNGKFLIDRPYDEMVAVFNSLTQRDGMGIAALHREGEISSLVGYSLDSTAIADWIYAASDDIEWFTFHSRAATTAPRFRDDLCQPFIDKDKNFVLCHVGTISSIDVWSIDGQPVSDGRMVFELASRYSSEPLKDMYRANMYPCAGYLEGQPFRIGSLYQYTNEHTGGLLYTSTRVTTPVHCSASKTSEVVTLDGEDITPSTDYIRYMSKDYEDYKRGTGRVTTTTRYIEGAYYDQSS